MCYSHLSSFSLTRDRVVFFLVLLYIPSPSKCPADIPYSKSGAPLSKAPNCFNKPNFAYS